MKKVSIEKTDKILKARTNQNETVTVANVEFEVKRVLDPVEAARFVRDVADYCIRDLSEDDSGELTYIASWEDFGIRASTLNYFAGFNTDSLTVEKLYALCYETDVYDRIVFSINEDYFYTLVTAARAQVKHARKIIEKRSRFDALCNLLMDFVRKMANDTENVDKLVELAEKTGSADISDIVKSVIESREQSNGVDS